MLSPAARFRPTFTRFELVSMYPTIVKRQFQENVQKNYLCERHKILLEVVVVYVYGRAIKYKSQYCRTKAIRLKGTVA